MRLEKRRDGRVFNRCLYAFLMEEKGDGMCVQQTCAFLLLSHPVQLLNQSPEANPATTAVTRPL